MDGSKSFSVIKARSFNPKNSKVTLDSALAECRIGLVNSADSVCRISFPDII